MVVGNRCIDVGWGERVVVLEMAGRKSMPKKFELLRREKLAELFKCVSSYHIFFGKNVYAREGVKTKMILLSLDLMFNFVLV